MKLLTTERGRLALTRSAAMVVLVATTSAALAQPSVAMVSDVSGACTLTRTDETTDCAILDYLRSGDQLRLDAGAELSMVYLESAKEHRHAGPATIEVATGAPRLIEGEAGQTRNVDLLGDSGLAPLEQPFLAQAALVVRGSDDKKKLQLLTPKNSNILESRPSFRWSALESGTQYHFILTDEAGEQLLEAHTADAEFSLPSGMHLAEDAFYEWQVEARVASGKVYSASADFNVVSAERKAQIEGQRPVHGRPVSDRVIFATLMNQLGFRHEAERQWKAIAAERPDDANVSRLVQP